MQPALILFDYGQTLIHEPSYDALRGNQAVLDAAVKNPDGITAAELCRLAEEIQQDILAEFHVPSRQFQPLELPGTSFDQYLWRYFGLEFDLPAEDLTEIFWDNAAPGRPADGITELLDELSRRGIAAGVVSNLMYSQKLLTRRINRLLPGHSFAFILSSCDYVFRKPHRRIFDLALRLARCPAGAAWFCGDNPRCDMEGAHAMGMDCFWYTKYLTSTKYTATPADMRKPDFVTEIKDWPELTTRLRSLHP